VIGDELLKGKVTDTNTAYAIGELRRRGIDVKRVAILPDDLDDIQREIRGQSASYDLVITSGGVGPTHDDVTLRALALALGQPIKRSETMEAMIRDAYGVDELTPEQAKMTMLPSGVRLRRVPVDPAAEGEQPSRWPIVQAQNVFVLPGVPSFFRSKLDVILKHFVATDRAVFTRTLVLTTEEEQIVPELNQAVKLFPSVTFGSYPSYDTTEYKTVITIEGDDEELVARALAELKASLQPETIVRRTSVDLQNMLN